MKKNILQRFVLGGACAFLLMGASCSLPGAAPRAIDGGVFRSIDAGATWLQKTAIPETGGRIVGFADAHVTALTQDPQDHNVLYLATADKGLLQSMDAAERWTSIPYFGPRVTGVAVDYFNKCEFYGLTPNRLSRSLNCGRDFKDVLTETRQGYELKKVVTDHFNRNVVYAATSREILKSADNGDSWTTVKRFEDTIVDVLMDSADSRVLMVGLRGSGIWRSVDAGASWVEQRDALSKFDGGTNILKIVQYGRKAGAYLVAADHGLLKTLDGGATWESITLLTPVNTVKPLAVTVDPANDQIIYYATSTTLYKSIDGGKTWKTQALPTTRWPSLLTVDFKDSKVLYLGTRPIPQQ